MSLDTSEYDVGIVLRGVPTILLPGLPTHGDAFQL